MHRSVHLKLAAVVLAGLVVLSGCGGSVDARRASHVARGQKYLADGRPDKARVEFANALQIAPNHAQTRYLYGQVSEQLGDFRTAASMYRRVLDLEPDHEQARDRLARLYLAGGLPEQALQVAGPALEAHPDDPKLLAVRGAVRALQQDRVGARADAERAVAIAPLDIDAVLLLANLDRLDGQPARGIELLNTTVAKLPQSAELHQALARLYQQTGDNARVEEQLRLLVQLKPRELPWRLLLASFYIGANRQDDAEQTLKSAVEAVPQSVQAKLVYAEFLATYRSAARGESALSGYIRQEPRNLELQLGLGSLQQRYGQAGEAEATYRRIIDADPSGASGSTARVRLATLEVAAGRSGEALKLLAAGLERNPRDADALLLRGKIELAGSDAVAAIADLRAVLRDQPRSVLALRTLARAYLANHQVSLAEDTLRTGLSAEPRDIDVRVDLADLLVRTHRVDEAIAVLQEAIRSVPGAAGTGARVALIEAYVALPDLQAARSAAQELKTLRPDLAAAPYLLGQVAQRQGRTGDAQREYEQALKLNPNAIDALAALARLEFERGQHAQAIALVSNAREHAADRAGVENLLGELHAADRDYPRAAEALNEALRVAPRWATPYGNLARVRLAAKDTPGAIAAYEAGVQATGEPVLVVELAELYVREGRIDDAIRQYELLQQRSPHHEVAANNLAMLLVTYRTDAASLDRARDLTAGFAHSDVGALLDTRGWVMFKRGELPEAIAALQQAQSRSPDSRVILYHLGMAEMKAGDTAKARATLEAALAGGASFPGTEEARQALAQLQGRTG